MNELEKVNAVQKMQDYIENNLNKNITLYELAKCSNYSPWYSAKLFKEYIGKGPFEYIRLMRLTKSALELRDNDKNKYNCYNNYYPTNTYNYNYPVNNCNRRTRKVD